MAENKIANIANQEVVAQVNQLSCAYDLVLALDNVCFEIHSGSVLALVGPNGAGKSTLMRCLAALQHPSSGSVHISGYNTALEPREAQKHIGYLSDNFGLYEDLTARQNLYLAAAFKQIFDASARQAIEQVIEDLELAEFLDRKAAVLSRGQKQRIGIAQAIIHKPSLLILDEPASGLDPQARHLLSQLIIKLQKQGMSLMVSSHILSELEQYSTHLLILQNGRLIDYKPIGGWAENTNQRLSLSLRTAAEDMERTQTLLSGYNYIYDLQYQAPYWHFELDVLVYNQSQLLKNCIGAGLIVNEFFEKKIDIQSQYIKTLQNR